MISEADILKSKILIVDDLEANVLLLRQILQGAGYLSITSTQDPRQVCELHSKHHYDVILLDLQMPHINGFEVIEALKKIEPDDYLPILVVTAQRDQKLKVLNAGAKDFIAKPFELAEVLARVHNMLEVRLLYKQLHNYNDVLEKKVREKTAELKKSYLETITAMTHSSEQHEGVAGQHLQRISHYSRAMAKLLKMDEAFIDTIFFASPMHDVGNINTVDEIVLQEVGIFTSNESNHTTSTNPLVKHKSLYQQMGADIALNHHEHWDGTGYPNGKAGEDIPIAARIMNIGNIYDTLRSKKSYRPICDHLQAVEIITHGDGHTMPAHFDPAILDAFTHHHEVFRDIFEAYSEQ